MRYILLLSFLLPITQLSAQGGYAFGPKGGLTVGIQQYNGFSQRDPLFAWHGAFFIESLTEENSGALYAQLGHHVKGSAIRTRQYQTSTGDLVRGRTFKSKFFNISLQAGAKQKFEFFENGKWYYLIGLRGEYTYDTDLPIFAASAKTVNDVVFGFTAGGGIEWMWSELVGGIVELSVSPDFTNQIFVPAQPNPYNPSQLLGTSEVKNISIELTVGLRLLRIVEYID